MFNGMMDPEMIRLAQEQMSRMSPADLARIQQQMMSNPDLLKMASESMKNFKPEDMKFAAEQLKHTRPEEMAEISEKMANSSPEEISAMRARLDAQLTYELNAAQMLKKQGNELHSQGKYNDALQKYLLAKKNLKGVPVSKGRSLLLACSLNSMSCYLKTKQYEECIREGTEVLEYDAHNVKALYRRGQAYEELGQLLNAMDDLNKAHEVSPDDETITAVLRGVEDRFKIEGDKQSKVRVEPVIKEITEEEPSVSPQKHEKSAAETSVSQAEDTSDYLKSHTVLPGEMPTTPSESLQALKDDPESMRSIQNFISRTDPETLAAFGKGKAEGTPTDMLKTASNVIGKMSPDELQRMLQLASSFQGENPFSKAGSNNSPLGSIPPEVTPDMLKTATDMMSKMSPEETKKMFEMASSLKERGMGPAAADLDSNGLQSVHRSGSGELQDNTKLNRNNVGESSSSHGSLSSRSAPQPGSSTSTADLQEQMRNQMRDPAMQQMFSSMMKNISPDMMASMSEQFGVKLSREDAEKAQQAMASMSPDSLERMMKWADRMQRGAATVKKTKNWLLGRPGIILAVVMLLLAVILHRLGYIGY